MPLHVYTLLIPHSNAVLFYRFHKPPIGVTLLSSMKYLMCMHALPGQRDQAAPPTMNFKDATGAYFNTVHANDFEFFNELNQGVYVAGVKIGGRGIETHKQDACGSEGSLLGICVLARIADTWLRIH
jgi:hypothetical protein